MLKLSGVSALALLLRACKVKSDIAVEKLSSITKTSTTVPSLIPSTSTPNPTPGPTGVPQEMVSVEAGTFLMGSEGGFPNERPVHKVNITRPFYMGIYKVTLDQYGMFCLSTGKTLSDDHGWGRGNRPAISLTWVEAVEYCNWLSEIEGYTPCYSGVRKNTECDFTANGFRLPTEAEWEFAARGGIHSEGYRYPGSDDPLEVAWHDANSNGLTHPVGQLKPNELGIFDLAGNGAEWCWDWYAADYYQYSPQDNPTGLPREEIPTDIFKQVKSKRGGYINASADYIYSTFRSADNYNWPGGCIRLVRTIIEE